MLDSMRLHILLCNYIHIIHVFQHKLFNHKKDKEERMLQGINVGK